MCLYTTSHSHDQQQTFYQPGVKGHRNFKWKKLTKMVQRTKPVHKSYCKTKKFQCDKEITKCSSNPQLKKSSLSALTDPTFEKKRRRNEGGKETHEGAFQREKMDKETSRGPLPGPPPRPGTPVPGATHIRLMIGLKRVRCE